MKIIIDGDACPSIPLIESKAKEFQVEVIIFCDINHYIQSDYAEVKVVDSGFQSVDMHIVNTLENGDIIITQDYGVAAMCISKAKGILNPCGFLYTEDNINRLLEKRHMNFKIRRSGGRTENPKKRTIEDDKRLLKNIEYMIKKK